MQQNGLDEWTRILISGQWRDGERQRYPYPSYWEELAKQPDAPLPPIGEYLEKSGGLKQGELMQLARNTLGDTTQLFPNAPERPLILTVLRALDSDYELMREDLALIPPLRKLLEAGNSIVPDLSTGRYRWVKTAPLEREPLELDVLTADIFFNDRLHEANVKLPIVYDEKDEVQLADFVAAELPPHSESTVMRVFVAPKRPANTGLIPWRTQLRPRKLPYTRTQIEEMNQNYVAINVNEEFPYPFMFRCAICQCEAHLGNRRLMESFCSTACHTAFLSHHTDK